MNFPRLGFCWLTLNTVVGPQPLFPHGSLHAEMLHIYNNNIYGITQITLRQKMSYFRNSAFNIQGGGVKFYLKADPMDPDKERIAIFTYMDEQPIDANKYYLQRFTNNSSIVAITGSQLSSAPLYIFRFRSV